MTPDAAYAAVEGAFVDDVTREALERLTDEQRRVLREYWVDRADGELTTALSFEFMLDDLRTEGAPSTLLDLAMTAIRDEHRHVDWCVRWADRVSPGEPARASFAGTRPCTFEDASGHDNRLLRTVFGGCFSETVAVHVLKASHATIAVDSVRLLNHQHVKEEVGHARLGWALLSWPGVTARDRSMIAEHVPEMLRLTRDVWLSKPRPADDALHRLGFLSSPLIEAACGDAIETVVLPGLEHHRIR